jgi:hypothetical protein
VLGKLGVLPLRRSELDVPGRLDARLLWRFRELTLLVPAESSLCHRDTGPSTFEIDCEIGLKRFAHLWWEKAKGQEEGTLFVDLGETLFEGGRYQQEESISTSHFQHAFPLIKPEEMLVTMIRTSKVKLQFCK